MKLRIGNEKIRFWRHFKKSTNKACWIWKGATTDGYGVLMGNNRKTKGAHIVSWEIHNKKSVPKKMEVCHSCDTTNCVNPFHLFLGTHTDNMRDCIYKGRRPILKGEDNGNAFLTEKEVLEIRKLRFEGYSNNSLQLLFNVSRGQITNITTRKSWKHI